MDLEQMTQILAEGDNAALQEVMENLMKAGVVKVVREPALCLVMLRARETVQQQPFNLGEVLITEAVVEIDGAAGYGFVLGDEPQKALCFAVVEAALKASHPQSSKILSLMEKDAAAVRERKLREFAPVARTRVNFEVMEG